MGLIPILGGLDYWIKMKAAKKADNADQAALDVSKQFAQDYTNATRQAIDKGNQVTRDEQNYNNSRATTLQNYLADAFKKSIADTRAGSADSLGGYQTSLTNGLDKYKADNATSVAGVRDTYGKAGADLLASYGTAGQKLDSKYAGAIDEAKSGFVSATAPMQTAADGYMSRAQTEDPSLRLAHGVTLARTAEAGDANKTASANLWAKRGNESRARGEAMLADMATEKAVADENAAYGVKDMAMRSDNRDKGTAIINQLASMGVNLNQLVSGMQTEGARASASMQTEGAGLVAQKQAELAQLVAAKEAAGSTMSVQMELEGAKLIADKKDELEKIISGMRTDGTKAVADVFDKNTSSNIAMVLANALRNIQLNLGGVAQSGGTLQDAQRIRADSVGANAAAISAALSNLLAGINEDVESAAKMFGVGA